LSRSVSACGAGVSCALQNHMFSPGRTVAVGFIDFACPSTKIRFIIPECPAKTRCATLFEAYLISGKAQA
jgi:hypothetical protein